MNDFKESLKVEREKTGEVIITEQLKNLLIQLMQGNISKKEVIELTDIKGKTTVERKIELLVAQNPELKQLYNEYSSRKRKNFEGYNFRAEAIDMLRNDLSQSEMAKRLEVSRRSFSTKIKKLQDSNEDNVLGVLLKRHAIRKMKRQKTTVNELVTINVLLDKYEEQFPVGLAKYEQRTSLEVRKENLEKVITAIDSMIEEGMTLKQISERKIISESTYRKYKEELENLSKIINGDKEKEQ